MDYRPIIFPECSLSELSHTWSVFSTLSSSFTFYISRNKLATLLYSPQRRLHYTAATFCLLFLSLWVCYSGVWYLSGVQHQILLLGCYSGRWAGWARARVCGCTDRWMDGRMEWVCVFEREGGVGHLILCSKKTEMLSSNVSRLSCADEKKSASKRQRQLELHISADFEVLILPDSSRDCAAVCTVCFSPPALLRWPRNVLCVRLAVCQSTCVLRWRKAMRDDDTVLCHPLFKLLSIPAVVACETSPCRWITEQRCTSDKLQLLVMMLRHLSGSEAGEKTVEKQPPSETVSPLKWREFDFLGGKSRFALWNCSSAIIFNFLNLKCLVHFLPKQF